MHMRAALIPLATALAALASVSTAQAGMNNIHVNPALAPHPIPTIPNVTTRSLIIDTQLRLNCYTTRERNKQGVWVPRTRCN